MSKGKVFVVQRPAYFDRVRRGWINKYDITPASKHGHLVFLLKPGNIYKDRLEAAIRHLRQELADYTRNDHILAIGDPVAIAATVMVAAEKTGGYVSMLKYDRITSQYEAYSIDTSPNNG